MLLTASDLEGIPKNPINVALIRPIWAKDENNFY
jgi:hypothetical protein